MQNNKLSIKDWATDDRPREKLLQKGRQSLSDAELIAILIGSGNKTETAVDVAKRILNSVNNNLNDLGRLSINQLIKIKGIGEAKAISIAAALELGRRRKLTDQEDKPQIKSSQDAFQIVYPMLEDLSHEEFWILYLNRSNKVIELFKLSQGGISGTVIDNKIILKKAIENLSSSIILVHNHPSGNINPSEADKQITKKLIEASKLMEINVLDHLIISGNKYLSFADEGLLN